MPAWTTFGIDDLNATKVAALVDACRTAALDVGQGDPMPGVISGVCLRVRIEIASCRSNVLDIDPAKIPAELKPLCCRMAVREMQSRLQIPLNEDEKEEKNNDLKFLERIQKCDIVISKSDNPQTTPTAQSGAAAQVITYTPARATRDQLDGL